MSHAINIRLLPNCERMLEKSRTPNVIQARVEMDNLHTKNARWAQWNANHVPYFPKPDLNYFMDLPMVIYQLKLAPAYIQDKIGQNVDSLKCQCIPDSEMLPSKNYG